MLDGQRIHARIDETCADAPPRAAFEDRHSAIVGAGPQAVAVTKDRGDVVRRESAERELLPAARFAAREGARRCADASPSSAHADRLNEARVPRDLRNG